MYAARIVHHRPKTGPPRAQPPAGRPACTRWPRSRRPAQATLSRKRHVGRWPSRLSSTMARNSSPYRSRHARGYQRSSLATAGSRDSRHAPPGLRVRPVRGRGRHAGSSPSRVSRARPASVTRRMSARAPASAAEPAAVIWYGRRRSVAVQRLDETALFQPGDRPVQGARAERHPGEVLDVLGQRMAVLRPLRQADQDEQRRVVRPAQPARRAARCHGTFLLRPK